MSDSDPDDADADATRDDGSRAAGETEPPDHLSVDANGLPFACRHRGDGDRLALCLHGFPDDPGTFDPLLDDLADAGFAAVAPYLRGYGPTGPAPDGDYSVGALAGDAVALADALEEELDVGGGGEPVLVGHDWGAVAGYAVGRTAPERFARVVGMAVPPAFAGRMLRSPRQWLRSWYVGFFQVPRLPERALRAREFALVERLWRRWSPGWDYPDERIASVKATFRSPGTVPAALAYYRQFGRDLVGLLVGRGGGEASDGGGGSDADEANDVGGGTDAGNGSDAGPPPVRTPTLVVAGADDGCIGAGLYADSDRAIAAESRTVVLDDAGHFVHRERPDAVADAVLSFVGE